MPKPELEFVNTDITFGWNRIEGAVDGMWEKVLSRDPETKKLTRLVKFEPGIVTNTVMSHEYWEEVYILEGFLTDRGKEITVGRGFYACRPPGMKHGPYDAPLGCTMFEVQYYQ